MKTLENGLIGYSSGLNDEDLKTFLAKPRPLKTGTLSDVALVDSQLFRISLNGANLFTTGSIWYQKLLGYYGLSGDIRLRLQVNANPFQCGLLKLCYIPCLNDMGTSTFDHTTSPVAYSQLPGIVYDINCNTEVDLVIPYHHVVSQYQLASGVGSWGTVYCFYYTAFSNATGSAYPDYTLWVSIEDSTLTGPALPIIAQAGKRKVKINKKDREQENASGPVQSFIDSALPYVEAMAEVPLLSTIATPVSWIASGISAVCSWFGWSKPLNTQIPARMRRTYFEDINNSNSASNAVPLAVSRNNQLEIDPSLTWEDQDEMAIRYIAGKSGYYKRFQWSTADITGTELLNFKVDPTNFGEVIGGNTYLTPTGYLSRIFGMWRGSICFRFRFAKTEFHNGRVIISFAPQPPGSSAVALTLEDTNYLLREVVDVRSGSEFVFTIPYYAISPYLMRGQGVGTLSVMVLNPLTNPAVVTSNITCNVEQYSGDDIEFAFPKDTDFSFKSIIAQSGDKTVTPGCAIAAKVIGSAHIDVDTAHLQARYCIGEKVTTLKQLVMRSSYFPLLNTSGSNDQTLGGFKPHVFLSTPAGVPVDTISKIAPLYTFARGSLNFTFVAPDKVDPATTPRFSGVINSCNQTNNSNLGTGAGTFANCNNESFMFEDTAFGPVHVNVPTYSQCPAMLVTPYNGANVSQNTSITSRSYLFRMSDNGTLPSTATFRGGADDFYCSLFIGVPAITGVV